MLGETLQPLAKMSPLVDNSPDYSTTLQTPSPLTRPRNELSLSCRCGASTFITYQDKLNCRGCGVFAIRKAEGYVFVSFPELNNLLGFESKRKYFLTRLNLGDLRIAI